MNLSARINKKMLVLIDQGIFSGQSFVINIMLAHLLPVKEFGVFSSVILMCYLLVSVTNSLVVNPLQINLHKVKNPATYLTFGFAFQITLSIAILSIIGFSFGIFFPKGGKGLHLSILLFSFSFLLYDYFRKILLAADKLSDCLTFDLIQVIFQIGLLILFSVLGISSLSFLLMGLAIAYYPALLFSITKSRIGKLNITAFKFYSYIHLKQGYWLLFTAILQWMSGNFFTMVSGLYLGLEALGAFRLVQSLFGLLNVLLQTFENYVLPSAARLHAKSANLSKTYIKKITYEAGVFFLLILVSLFLFSEQAISIFGGSKFLPFAYVVKLMSILYLLIYVSYPLRLRIRLTNQNKLFFTGYFLSFIFSVCSFHFFLKYGNLAGAAVGLMMNQLLLITYWKYNLNIKNI